MNDIAQIEVSLDEAREAISRRDAMLKLKKNREFRQLVLDGFFKEEAVRLVSVSAEPAMEPRFDAIIDNIKAISIFRQYMDNIIRIGDFAAAELADYEAALDEARNEDAD